MDEAALRAGLRRGDVEAFEALYAWQGRSVQAFLASLGWKSADAEDAVQEVFLRAWRQRRSLSTVENPAAWLFRIARNLSVDSLRARERELAWRRQIESGALDVDAAEPERPHEPLERAELHRRILDAIDALPEPMRAVLVLKKIAGLTIAEIASILEVPAGTVASRLWTAVQRVAAVVQDATAVPPRPLKRATP